MNCTGFKTDFKVHIIKVTHLIFCDLITNADDYYVFIMFIYLIPINKYKNKIVTKPIIFLS